MVTVSERARRTLEAMRHGEVLSSEKYDFGENEHNQWARLGGRPLDTGDPSGGMDVIHELLDARLITESDRESDPTNANHETIFYVLHE